MASVSDFEAAVAAVPTLSNNPGNQVKLELYGLFKQATVGDVSGKRPGFTDMVGRAKYDAWSELSGTSAQDARSRYVEIVQGLIDAEA